MLTVEPIGRSTRDPEELLKELAVSGCGQSVCVNDLEPPAFKVMPSLAALKDRLIATGLYRCPLRPLVVPSDCDAL